MSWLACESSEMAAYAPLCEPTNTEVRGCFVPSFERAELETLFQVDRRKRLARWGVEVARTLTLGSALAAAAAGLKPEGDHRLLCVGGFVTAGAVTGVWWLLACFCPRLMALSYNVVAGILTLGAMLLASSGGYDACTEGMPEAISALIVSGMLGVAAQFIQLSSAAFFFILHVVIVANLTFVFSIAHVAENCETRTLTTERQLLTVLLVYIPGILMFHGRRSQEIYDRKLFVADTSSRGLPYRTLDPGSDVEEQTCGSCMKVAPPAADIVPVGDKVVKPADLKVVQRDRKVPPPSMESNDEAPRKQAMDDAAHRVPNPVLAKAMFGKKADWAKIRSMARKIRNKDYEISLFFEDCVASFPELRLFFVEAKGISNAFTKKSASTSSGIAAEAEYQRTIGAFFAVYWLLRLDADGKAGFCYGANDDWSAVDPGSCDIQGKTFFKMTPDEKRWSFLSGMEWAPFEDLVHRAGCDGSAEGTERIIALLCLTAFHDIMKLQILQPIVQPDHAPYNGYEAGVRILDHDLALGYVLEYYPNLLPSYAGLSDEQKRSVLFTQGKMQFNHGWFVQAEAPPGGMLSKFKSVLEKGARQADIDLYFLHWITDVAGAEATPLGGAEKLVLKFPHNVLASFLWSMPFLSKLAEVSETALVEEYLEARWKALLPEQSVPDDLTAIAVMRLVIMTQGEDALMVVEAFRQLSASDQNCLSTELSRTGCSGQAFRRHNVCGGPAFLLYYGPALMQRNNRSKESLVKALRAFCVVLRGARALWPMSLKSQNKTVIIQIGELKVQGIEEVIQNPGGDSSCVWIMLRNNDQEGCVTSCKLGELNGLYMDGSQFRVLDFTQEKSKEAASTAAGSKAADLEPTEVRGSDFSSLSFKHGRRILVFTDMSTECDDECALLWLLAALNRRGEPCTVELVHTDSYVRIHWMAHILNDKFSNDGPWRLTEGGTSFLAGSVLVNMYLAHSTENEERIIADIQKKAPNLPLALKEENGKKTGIRQKGSLGGEDYTQMPAGALDSVVVNADIRGVSPEFFQRFSLCKCVYVVGSPGGVNCPMPIWVSHLAALHKLAPVLYLTPQLTRAIRFPRSYVAANVDWNDTIKHTVWDATVTFMARRPEIPAKFGNWGLILRLNVANAMFCKDWYRDHAKTNLEDAIPPEDVCKMVQAYVDRNSGNDRGMGAVIDELRNISVEPGIGKNDLDAKGLPVSDAVKECVRQKYKEELYKQVMACVLTTNVLLFQNKQNMKIGTDEGGFEVLKPRCGYADPLNSLADVFGAEDAINLVQKLPLRYLTPAYDVVAMICADAALEEGTGVDGGLGLLMEPADDTMGLGLLSKAQRELSTHPVLMTPPQKGEGIYAVGPFG
eukprot:TRINITY_DN110917_c0_g1_i1.p1 TRINITY_DN110917_c0_g1~~TRINITY_DN110917_c0_g1_i1.p1  ORF type:complete len:1359 (-),score=274.04 TRINITY_DN110917_c0_g1_i1:169-4245(-)